MNLTAADFKGSKIAKSVVSTDDIFKARLDDMFSKGKISAEHYNKVIKPQSDDLQKGEIMDRLGYSYGGGSEPIKFTKTGKELKEMMPSIIAKLNAKKAIMVGKMSAFQTLSGIEPSEEFDGISRYPWSACEAPYDDVNKKYGDKTDQMKACSAYNDCAYQVRNINEDIRACEAIAAGVEDKQKYNLTISQLIALNVK